MKMRNLSALLIAAMITGLFSFTPVSKAHAADDALMLWYRFNEGSGATVADSSGNHHDGTLNGTYYWTTAPNGSGAVKLDGKTGYVSMPNGILAGITDITVATSIYVDPDNVDPAWIFTFGSAADPRTASGTRYFGLLEDSSKNLRSTITTDRWSAEQNTSKGASLSRGVWKHIAYTLSGTTGTLYEDGVQIAQNTSVSVAPKDIESTIANYIGKPAYPPDKYFKGKVSDFRIYSRALTSSEVKNIWIESLSDTDAVNAVKGLLDLGDISAVKTSISLPNTYANTSISWSSENTSVITNDGTVTRPSDTDIKVNMTGTIMRGSAKATKVFSATVLKSGAVYSLDSTSYTLYKHKTHATILTATFDDLTTVDVTKDATFTSSDTEVATVDADGAVTGINPGNATITATYNGIKYAAAVTVVNDMVVWYKFDETSGTIAEDSSGNGRNGTLNGGATWMNGNGVQLDGSNGYVQMPNGILAGLKDTTVSAKVFVDPSNINPSWIFNFGSTTDSYNDTNAHYFGLLLNNSAYRVVLSKTHWTNEQSTSVKSAFSSGVWKYVTYTQTGNTGTLYIDGVQVAKNTEVAYTPQDIETTVANFIGKAPYTQDNYFKGKIADFRLYNRALSAAEIEVLSDNGSAEAVALDKAALDLGDLNQVISKITLPAMGGNGSTISWKSSDESLVSASGVVTRPQYSYGNKQVILTATITKGSASDTKTFIAIVIALPEGGDQVIETAKSQLVIYNADDVRGNITLPTTINVDGETVNITWTTDRADIVNVNETVNSGYDNTPAGVVTRPDVDTKVILTAHLTHGTAVSTKDITIKVKAKPVALNESDYKGYLFAYFNGTNRSDAEQIYFASSTDGLHWKDLNNNNPVLTSSVGDKGVRDPYILRSPEGDKFYMVATDLRIANGAGWSAAQTAGSRSIVVWESDDLINWSKERLVKVARDDAGCTWAPEVVYDDKTGEYLVFWASRIAEDNYAKQRIYIAKTRDFYTFTEPEVWIDRTSDVIDADVIKQDGIYYRFSKDEVNKNIIIDKSNQLLHKDFALLQSDSVGSQSGVEGPACFKFNGENKWCLLLDNYGGSGYYPLVSNDIASGVFTRLAASEYSLPSGPRHGAVMQITQAEYDAVMAKWAGSVVKPDEQPQQNPIVEYKFDETNTGSTILDTSGNNRIGTLYGNATYVQDSEKGQVLYLDGTTGTFASFPQGFFEGRNTVTISMDIKPETVTGDFFTFAIGQDSTKYMFLRTRDTQIRNAITVNSWSSEQEVKAATDSIRDKWMNIKLVITPTSMAIYKDGLLLCKNSNISISMSDLGADLLAYLGKSFYSADQYFKGYFDNVKVYNRALTETEIAKEFGITDINPIKSTSADGYNIITTKADAANKKITVYFSRNNSTKKDLKEVPLTYELSDGCIIDGINGQTVDLTNPVSVTINLPDQSQEVWTVEGVLCNSPVLGGEYADPNIAVFNGKYYIYPTTDGYYGWSGTQFHVFSSDDLVNWTDGGVILDAGAGKDVPWSVGSAWAPTIEEKNGKYYFYFCAKRSDGKSCIGAATSDSPTGPFTAEANPLITPEIASAAGVTVGQTIDPSIFTDDDGTSYMLFGNGSPAIVQLNDDMISIKPGTMQKLSGATDFRESMAVTKRNGLYHFTWSCDDTGSEDYHVNYGTSNNLYGPIQYQYAVLAKDTSKDILGTGHQSILKIPGKDEYYIAYHRFVTPLGQYSSGLGYHRETCIDRLEFDEVSGLMKVVTPTLEGITTPVTEKNDIKLDRVSLISDKSSLNLTDTAALTLSGTMTDGAPADFSNAAIEFFNDNPEVTTMSATTVTTGAATAVVIPLKEGTSNITASVNIGGVTKTSTVQITVVNSNGGGGSIPSLETLDAVTLTADKTNLGLDDTAQLTLSGTMTDGTPADFSNAEIAYTVDNPGITTVSATTVTTGSATAVVTPLKEGTANITVNVTINGVEVTSNKITIVVQGNSTTGTSSDHERSGGTSSSSGASSTVSIKNTDTASVVNSINTASSNAVIKVDVSQNKQVGKEIFDAIKGANKTVVFEENGIEWTFNGKDITGDTKAIDTTVNIATINNSTSVNRGAIAGELNNGNALVISFANNGQLPGKAAIKLKLDAQLLANLDKNNLNVYYYNETTKTMETVASGLKVDAEGYLQFNITHNSDYIITDKALGSAEFVRLSGSDRYETNIKISQAGWKTSNYAVLATGEDFPDALSAAPLAKKYNAPILITGHETLNASVEQEIQRLGVKNIFIIGGTGAVSQEIEDKLTSKGISCTRIKGSDRYETSAAIADYIGASKEVVVATGTNFPDALSIASYAALNGMPILLTKSDSLPDSVSKYIAKSGVMRSYVVGGTSAINDSVLNALPGAERLSGDNRYATNTAILKKFSSEFDLSKVYFATGENFPDALTGSALAASVKAPIILVNSNVTDGTSKFIKENISRIKTGYALGGSALVPDSVKDILIK